MDKIALQEMQKVTDGLWTAAYCKLPAPLKKLDQRHSLHKECLLSDEFLMLSKGYAKNKNHKKSLALAKQGEIAADLTRIDSLI